MPQERIATPSIWTVQAPHCAMPQPYFVPVRPAFSRISQRSGVSGSTSTSNDLPLIVRFAIAIPCYFNPSIELQGELWTGTQLSSNQYCGFAERIIAWEACRFTLLPCNKL